MSLLYEMNEKALKHGIPLSVHIDVTYRCNERCDHCYLDHEDHGEMTTGEIKNILDQLAASGTFFLTFSGGEVFLRRDFLEIVAYARKLLFNVKVKTNAVMIHEHEARELRRLGVEQVQISVYSHRPEVHDAITRLPGSLKKTLRAIRFLKDQGLKVTIANVLMKGNLEDYKLTQELANELGVRYTLDPTVTPKMDGDRSILNLRVPGTVLPLMFHDETLVGDVEKYCAAPSAPDEDVMGGYPCSAGHTSCYITPYAEVFPCVQFPIVCGNLREQRFEDIWRNAPQFHEVRSIRARDLTTCSGCGHVGTCSRCPGLAYMEGDMRGPSTADCEKSYYRTGIHSENMRRQGLTAPPPVGLVQIVLFPPG
jgi:AdoMet-dependent heme synthase